MTKLMLAVIALIILAPPAAQAQGFWSGRFDYDTGGGYTPREFSLDLLGCYATRDRHGSDSDAWGVGVGVNFFFSRYIGIGADTYADAFKTPYLLNGSLIARYPVPETALAPYAFAGFGRQWDFAPQWLGHIGLGLEFRLNPRTGIFLDARRVFPDITRDYSVWRAGLRLAF